MQIISNCLVGTHIDHSYVNVGNYIKVKNMDQDRTWGTDVEIIAFSHLINTPIFSYDESLQRWLRFTPSNANPLLSTPGDSSCESIYINHPENHFQVVLDVRGG